MIATFAERDWPVEFSEITGVQTTCRVFAAYSGPMLLGALSVDATFGTIELVYVYEGFRRQGIATTLLAVARKTIGLPLEHDTGLRSPDGTRWARALHLTGKHRYRRWAQREADARGSMLMVGVYGGERRPLTTV